MKYYYYLPKKNFFKRGFRGSVMHALGIIEGFKQNEIELEVIHFGGLSDFVKSKEVTYTNKVKALSHLISIVKGKNNRLLIRYSISNLFLFKILTFFRDNSHSVCLEVNTVHGMYRKKGIFSNMIVFFEKIILNKNYIIYTVSNGAMDFLRHAYGINPDNIIVVPNALIKVEEKMIERGQTQRLVYFGSLHRYYDIFGVCNWLLEFNQNTSSSTQLHIYGNDDSNLVESLKSSFPEIVKFHGKYDNKDVHHLISDLDILLLPYKKGTIAEYGSPTKVFEYMSLGLPILSSSIGQLNEIIEDNRNGLLYETKHEFLAKLSQLMEDGNLRRELGRNAYLDVVHEHLWSHRIEKLVKEWE